jgi:bile acid-coenzyme A ligase
MMVSIFGSADIAAAFGGQCVDDAQATQPSVIRPLGECLTIQALRSPAHTALTSGVRTLSRDEIERQANRMARALSDQGVIQNDLVAIILPTGPEHHIVSFAIWKLGATPMPLSPAMPGAELRDLLAIAQPRLIVGLDADAVAEFATVPADYVANACLSDEPLPGVVSKHFKAICSGGSTGRPKIILDGMPASLDPDRPMPFLLLQSDDVMLHAAPMYHSAPFSQTNWGLAWGLHIVEMAKFDPLEWLRLIEAHRVTWTCLVPTMMNRIWALPAAERSRYDLSSLRVVLHTAAPCPPWLKEAWIDWLGPSRIWEIYSGTEGFGGALINGADWLAHRGSVGRSMTDIRILDDAGKVCAPGEVGELWFPAAPANECRYLGGELRARDGWRTLGDMGWLDEEGFLYIADRRTDMIVSGGANIFPAEIEAALEAHPAIASSVVVGLAHEDFGRVPHAIIELRRNLALDPLELEDFLTARLARYKLPYTFELASHALRNESGKVRRSEWRDAAEKKLAAGEMFMTLRPRNSAR